MRLDLALEQSHQILLDIHGEEIAWAAVVVSSLSHLGPHLMIRRRQYHLEEFRIGEFAEFVGVEEFNNVVTVGLSADFG